MTEKNGQHDGRLAVPLREPSTEAALAIQKLVGAETSTGWLAEHTGWEELDHIRAQHLRVRGQLAVDVNERNALEACFRAEDQAYSRERREALLQNRKVGPDKRTPPDQRQAARKAIEERLDADVVALGEIRSRVIALFQAREDDWLADLRVQLKPAEEKEREAERLLNEARVEKWMVYQLGDWVQKTADLDRKWRFGQPAPEPSLPPKQFSPEAQKAMLERPWHDRPEHDPFDGMRPHLAVDPNRDAFLAEAQAELDESMNPPDADEADTLPAGDPTGVVQALDPDVSGVRR